MIALVSVLALRAQLVWDTVDAGDTATGEDRQCTAVAMPIVVPDASFVDTAWDGCSEEDIVIQGNARYNTLRARLEFVRGPPASRPAATSHPN